jgi:hypothetical protein
LAALFDLVQGFAGHGWEAGQDSQAQEPGESDGMKIAFHGVVLRVIEM